MRVDKKWSLAPQCNEWIFRVVVDDGAICVQTRSTHFDGERETHEYRHCPHQPEYVIVDTGVEYQGRSVVLKLLPNNSDASVFFGGGHEIGLIEHHEEFNYEGSWIIDPSSPIAKNHFFVLRLNAVAGGYHWVATSSSLREGFEHGIFREVEPETQMFSCDFSIPNWRSPWKGRECMAMITFDFTKRILIMSVGAPWSPPIFSVNLTREKKTS